MIGIHQTRDGFSDRWIEFCTERDVPIRLVNCFSPDIVHTLNDCHGLMWHWHHWDHKSALFARQLTLSLERAGLAVFPSSATAWHYDDKVGQKYLLESVGAPLVPSVVFYSRDEAFAWASHAVFPKVFKLRGGAGSENVRLVKHRDEAMRFIAQSFGSGWSAHSRMHPLRDRLWHFRRDKSPEAFVNIARGLVRVLRPHPNFAYAPRERGYVYFQDFVPNNNHDIRVVIIGRRAFAVKRMTRRGDFRASGSGALIHDPAQIPLDCVEIAFRTSHQLRTQCLAYDFVFENGKPLIVEVSYAFSLQGYVECPGWWDDGLNWHAGKFEPQDFMIEDFLRHIQATRSAC